MEVNTPFIVVAGIIGHGIVIRKFEADTSLSFIVITGIVLYDIGI